MATVPSEDRAHPSAFRALASGVRTLFPGYFALVMATGVVSIASFLLGYIVPAQILLALNGAFYVALWALTLARAAFHPRRIVDDLFDHQRGPGYFTTVAATCVLGTQTVIVGGRPDIGFPLWWFGLGLWFVVMYAFFTAVTVRRSKPSLASGINGAWLTAAVATQSLVVLRGVLGEAFPPPASIQLLCLAMFMVGAMLYLAIIPLIFYRLTFIRLESRDFSPPYWINMGAVAITALAGCTLLTQMGSWPILDGFEPFLRGFTLFCWSAASWWIPFLISLMVWRYGVRRDRLSYEPAMWGMVFPLGMYTTGTFQIARVLDLPFLQIVPAVFVFVAVAAWIAVFVGLVSHLARTFYPAGRQAN